MTAHIEASVQTQVPSYYFPTVSTKIQNLEKIYFVAAQTQSAACLVFTEEKTRDAASRVLKGFSWSHPSIPDSEHLSDDHCLTLNLEAFGKNGFLDNIHKILAYLGKQMENNAQNKKIPILLAFAESSLY